MTREETTRARQAAVAGVLSAGMVAVWACLDSMRSMSLPVLLALAVEYVVLAAVACTITFALCSRISSLCMRHHFLGALLIAVWSPALALCIANSSLWMLVPAAIMAVVWTIAVRSHVAATHGLRNADLPPTNAAGSFGASVLLQSSIGLALGGEPVWAMAPGTIASAIVAARCYPMGAQSPQSCMSLRHSRRLVALMTLAAIAVTGIALSRHLERGIPYASGGDQDFPPLFPMREAPAPRVVDDDDVHMGVIIWPEVQPKITLVAPLPKLGPSFGQTPKSDPLSIPFFGAYWIYRPPFSRPPANSLVLRGSPVDRKLRSTDHVRLKMEARQNLGTFFPIDCCSGIELVVNNGDTYDGTITMEVVLGDSTLTVRSWQSLGKAPVPPIRTVAPQPLSFPISANGPMKKFDEIVVIFHLAPMRADRAARVGIERFVLVPRGR